LLQFQVKNVYDYDTFKSQALRHLSQTNMSYIIYHIISYLDTELELNLNSMKSSWAISHIRCLYWTDISMVLKTSVQ